MRAPIVKADISFRAQSLQLLDEIEILLKVLALEARRETAIIIRRQVFELFELAGKKNRGPSGL